MNCLTDNLYVVEQFYKILAEYQNSKKDPKTLEQINKLIDETRQTTRLAMITSEISITDLLYRRIKTYHELDSMRDVLNEDVMALLDIMWDKLLKGVDSHNQRLECLIVITKHIMNEFPKRRIYRLDALMNIESHQRIDAYDVLFNFIFTFVNNFNIGDEVERFLKICRTLFYFNSRRVKDKQSREEAIFVSLKVLLYREVEYDNSIVSDQIETSEKLTIYEKLKRNPHEYLKAITHLNVELINSVKYETTSRSYYIDRWISEEKSVNVGDGYIDDDVRSRVSILKI